MADEEPGMMQDPPLMVTAGALGNEDRNIRHRGGGKRKKKGKSKRAEGHKKGRKGDSKILAPPVFSTAPLTPKENLAGRVDHYIRNLMGVKKIETKTAKPYHQINFSTEPTINFEIRSNKNEFIRFNPNSLNLVYYGSYANPNRNPNAANGTRDQAERHSLMASQGRPRMFMDPSVMGTGFFHKIEVMVDNVPCTTNSDLNNLLIQYVRCARVYTDKPPGPYFATSDDLNYPDPLGEPMRVGMEPFDSPTWNSREGYRMPVYLDGVFPFDLKNRTLESIDHREEPHLYFPPDTCITIKLHAHRTKTESIFHPELADNMGHYWDRAANVPNYDNLQIRFTIQDAVINYESVQLHPLHHVELMNAYKHGLAQYDYDRVCGQYTPLMADLSLVENRFQIDPFARLIYVLFLPDYATFTIDALRRPLSGLSRFPRGCTSMTVSFASEENLIHERLENFGVAGRRVDNSKMIYWQKLKDSRMTAATFEQWFPKQAGTYSMIQALVVDLRNHSSQKMESLVLRMEFSGNNRSPQHQQIVVLSVHPTGQLQCALDTNTGRWIWNFATKTYLGNAKP
jgi:hypothetical protein